VSRHDDLRNTGPCFYCRQAMDWLASDANCLNLCRWCLRYVASAGAYSVTLCRLAIRNAEDRGEIRRHRNSSLSPRALREVERIVQEATQ
jgi:hypothetical protein